MIGAHPSFFQYLKGEMDKRLNQEIPTHTTRFTQSRKVVHDSLAVSRRRVKFEGELIRVLFEDKLTAVRKVFGTTFGVGIMQPVPSLKMLRLNPS
jgi:hypothetical protein